MSFPSIPDIMNVINAILTVFSEGGQKAFFLLLMLNVIFVIGFCYLFIRFLIGFLKEHNDSKEEALAAKDDLLNEGRLRLENLVEQYTRLLTQSIEREQMLTNEVRELKALVTIFLSGNNKVRNYDRDEEDFDDAGKKRPRKRN